MLISLRCANIQSTKRLHKRIHESNAAVSFGKYLTRITKKRESRDETEKQDSNKLSPKQTH